MIVRAVGPVFQQEVTEESKENVSDAVTPNPTT